MRAFVMTFFWLYTLCTVGGLIALLANKAGQATSTVTAKFIVHAVITAWAAYLLWGGAN